MREELAGEDAALIQDALYDAEEYLRAEVAAHPDKSEADVLELIASTYGAPDEVASAYRDTEEKVKAAMTTPRKVPQERRAAPSSACSWIRAPIPRYSSCCCRSPPASFISHSLSPASSLSAGLSVLVIGVPFFLMFIALSRVVSLAEGRLIEAMTGERMPRRPVHQSHADGFWTRVGQMLKDRRTWTTLAYLILMLPLGIVYFVMAVVGLAVSLAFIFAPLVEIASRFGWLDLPDDVHMNPPWLDSLWTLPLMVLAGVLLLTLLMHLARGIGKLHAMYAKALLVAPTGPGAAQPGAAP